MIISPSIASSNLLRIADEVMFVNEHFNELHIDIEDGVVVQGISFGMKMTKKIFEISKTEKSLHLEVLNPLDYLEDIVNCKPDYLFIQVDHLQDPLTVVKKYLDEGINAGIAIGDRDMNVDYDNIFALTDLVLVSTAFHDDPNQEYQLIMENFAINLAKRGLQVWVDGGINHQNIKHYEDSNVYAAVIGRDIFSNEDLAVKNYCMKEGKNNDMA